MKKTDACLVLLFRLPGERGKVSSSRCFDVAVLSAAKNVAINEVALNVDNLEEYSLVGLGLAALNYFALLCWYVKHRCQGGGDGTGQTAAIPAAMPAPHVAAATTIAPFTPSVTEYHVDQQPRLFLLPKVTSTYYQKPSLFCYLRKNVLKQGKNIFVKFEGPDRGDVYRK